MGKIREQIKRLRERASPEPDSPEDQIFFVQEDKDAMQESADTMEAMLEVVEALDEYRDSLRDLFPNAIDDSSKLGKSLDKLKALQTNDD